MRWIWIQTVTLTPTLGTQFEKTLVSLTGLGVEYIYMYKYPQLIQTLFVWLGCEVLLQYNNSIGLNEIRSKFHLFYFRGKIERKKYFFSILISSKPE